MKRTPLKRKAPLGRSEKPIRRSNPKNRKRLFEENFGGKEYLSFIHSLPCDLCGVEGYSVAAHLKSRGAGGKAVDIAPLCRTRLSPVFTFGCHDKYDAHDPLARSHTSRLKKLAADRRAAWLRVSGTPELESEK